MAYSLFLDIPTKPLTGKMRNSSLVPVDLTLEITKKCPLNCLICSSTGGPPYSNELTIDELKRIIDEAQGLGTKTIIFSGGEPLEHPHLIDLCRHATHYDLDICVYTSGNIKGKDCAIDAISKVALSFLKNVPIDKMIFGLQGPTNEIHDSITGVYGSFDNAVRSIKRAVEESIPIEIHFVPVKQNYRTLPQMVMLARELRADKISVLRFVPQGRGKSGDSRLDAHELPALRSILEKVLSSKILPIRLGTPFNAFGLTEGNQCTAGRSRATIRADGFVFPCEAMKQFPSHDDNNLRRRSLEEIWQKSAIFQEARDFLHVISSSSCRNCKIFTKCRGGCPAQRLVLGNSIGDSPDPYCLACEVISKNV